MSVRTVVLLRVPLLVFSVALLAACGASLLGGGSSKPQCSGSQTTCLTTPSCSWDQANACEMCHCSPAMPPPDYTPQGPPRME